jgi:hypothetical protein
VGESDEAMTTKNLKHGDELLRQIAEVLKHIPRTTTHSVQVTFSDREHRNCFVFSLSGALDAIARDLYWDETGDWSEADTVTVEIL